MRLPGTVKMWERKIRRKNRKMSERKIRRNRKHQALILLFHSFYHSFSFFLFSSPTFSCSAARVVKCYLEDELRKLAADQGGKIPAVLTEKKPEHLPSVPFFPFVPCSPSTWYNGAMKNPVPGVFRPRDLVRLRQARSGLSAIMRGAVSSCSGCFLIIIGCLTGNLRSKADARHLASPGVAVARRRLR